MGPHLYSEIVISRFSNALLEQIIDFIEDDNNLYNQYLTLKEKYGEEEIIVILDKYLADALKEHKPIFFSSLKKDAVLEKFLEDVANGFISEIVDRVFLFIERNADLMTFFYDTPDALNEAQDDIRKKITDRFYLISTGDENDNPQSNLLNKHQIMMLKAEEE